MISEIFVCDFIFLEILLIFTGIFDIIIIGFTKSLLAGGFP
jgi:hypothetical protein